MGTPWKKAVREWKAKGGIVVHLTAYGENIQTSDVCRTNKGIKQRRDAAGWEAKRFQANFTQVKSQTSTWQLEISRIQSVPPWRFFWTATLKAKNWLNLLRKPKLRLFPKREAKKSKATRITWIFLNVLGRVLLPQVSILWVLKRNIRVCYRQLMIQP